MCMLGEDFSFADGSRLSEAFSHIPEAISNTVSIADRCDLTIEFGKIILPSFPLPAEKPPAKSLKILAKKGSQSATPTA